MAGWLNPCEHLVSKSKKPDSGSSSGIQGTKIGGGDVRGSSESYGEWEGYVLPHISRGPWVRVQYPLPLFLSSSPHSLQNFLKVVSLNISPPKPKFPSLKVMTKQGCCLAWGDPQYSVQKGQPSASCSCVPEEENEEPPKCCQKCLAGMKGGPKLTFTIQGDSE